MLARVDSLNSYEIGVTDLARATTFYRDIWGLHLVSHGADTCRLRARRAPHHSLTLHSADSPALLRLVFGVGDRATLTGLYTQVKATPVPILQNISALALADGHEGFVFHDYDGREIVICHTPPADQADESIHHAPMKLSHVVLNSPNADHTTAFYRDVLGFRLSDATKSMNFLRCARDHHAIAIAHGPSVTMNHAAWEMENFDALMHGAGRLKEHGHVLEWGVGRHGPGANIFAYYLDPDGFAVEYTTDIEQIDEPTHRPGTVADWQNTKLKRPDRWGMAGMPSTAMQSAMRGEGQQTR